MAPDRMSLQNMEKKTNETFHEYAHKWRDLAAQVQPPLTNKELNKMFLNTFKAPYYDRMIGNSNKDFSDVVSAGEMIEAGVKQGKIEASEAKKQFPKRKEEETHVVTYQRKTYNLFYPSQNYGYQPYNQYDGNAAQKNYQSNSRPEERFLALPPPVQVVTSQPMGQSSNNVRRARPQQERFKSDPIPMTYTELNLKLVQGGLLLSVDIPPLQPPYPRWYNYVHCDYHSGNREHSTKNCTLLKRKV